MILVSEMKKGSRLGLPLREGMEFLRLNSPCDYIPRLKGSGDANNRYGGQWTNAEHER